MKQSAVLEIPAFSIRSAIAATELGANRIELCANPLEGGTTPSTGTLTELKNRYAIPVFVMIRPRGGDFVWTEEEVRVMEHDIAAMGTCSADGFVFGALTRDKDVDTETCGRLIHAASGKPCTFHRAFDLIPDQAIALEKMIDSGFQRILTSGNAHTVPDGLLRLRELLDWADDRITIMPGGGLRPEHVAAIGDTGALREIHASCRNLASEGIDPAASNDEIDPKLVSDFVSQLKHMTRSG